MQKSSQQYSSDDEEAREQHGTFDYLSVTHNVTTPYIWNNNVVSSNEDIFDWHSSAIASSPSSRVTSDQWPGYNSDLWKIALEMIETERIYTDDLYRVIQGYMLPLTAAQNTMSFESNDISVNILFGNIKDIYCFNSQFLQSLEYYHDPVQMTQCFVNYREGFEVYTTYCTNYPSSVEMLTKCMSNEEISEILKVQQTLLRHVLPLGSYLLKPIQRILKYHLFLQKMLNCCEMDTAAHATIAQALEVMKAITHHMNEMKRRHERAVRVQEVQSVLIGWNGQDLTTLGNLLLEDTFPFAGARSSRLLLLFEKGLLIVKAREEGQLEIKALIKCSELMLYESIPGEPLNFHIIPFENPRIQYTVKSRSAAQKHEWCQEIKRLILNSYPLTAIPAKAKELVMMLGNEQTNDEIKTPPTGVMSPKKQHQAPAYLERRKWKRKISAPSMSVDDCLESSLQTLTQSSELPGTPSICSSVSHPLVHNALTSNCNGISTPKETARESVVLSSPSIYQQTNSINTNFYAEQTRILRPTSMIEDRRDNVCLFTHTPQPMPIIKQTSRSDSQSSLVASGNTKFRSQDITEQSFNDVLNWYQMSKSTVESDLQLQPYDSVTENNCDDVQECQLPDMLQTQLRNSSMNDCTNDVHRQLSSDASYDRELSNDSMLNDWDMSKSSCLNSQSQTETPLSLENLHLHVNSGMKHTKKQMLSRRRKIFFVGGKAFHFSQTGNNVTPMKNVDRTIQYLATPIWNFGPEEILQNIREGKECGRKILTFGTPPRASEISLDKIDNLKLDEASPKNRFFHSQTLLNDLQLFSKQVTLRAIKSAPVVAESIRIQQDELFTDNWTRNECLQHELNNSHALTLNEPKLHRRKGFLTSLRNAFGDLASKITRRSKQQGYKDSLHTSSRSKSFDSAYNKRVTGKDVQQTDESSSKVKPNDIPSSSSFFSRVAETYSSFRNKQSKKSKSPKQRKKLPHNNNKIDLTSLLKNNGCGSASVGERMAHTNERRYFGTYSLYLKKPLNNYRGNFYAKSITTDNQTGYVEPRIIVNQLKNSAENTAQSLISLSEGEQKLNFKKETSRTTKNTLAKQLSSDGRHSERNNFFYSSVNTSTESLDRSETMTRRSLQCISKSGTANRDALTQPHFTCSVVTDLMTYYKSREQNASDSSKLNDLKCSTVNPRNIKRSLSSSINEKIQKLTEVASNVQRTASEQSLGRLSEKTHELQEITTLSRIRQSSAVVTVRRNYSDKKMTLTARERKPPSGRHNHHKVSNIVRYDTIK